MSPVSPDERPESERHLPLAFYSRQLHVPIEKAILRQDLAVRLPARKLDWKVAVPKLSDLQHERQIKGKLNPKIEAHFEPNAEPMAQLRSLHLVHRSLLRKGCTHSIPPTLRARLVISSTCPSCQIARLVKDIRDVQGGLTTRGGIFVSKEKVLEEIEKGDSVKRVQAKRHRIWIKKWRATKIKIARLLVEFEEALGNLKEEGEDAGMEEIYGALNMWKEVEDEMCVVPGYGFGSRECEVGGTEEDKIINQIGDVVGKMVTANLNKVTDATKQKEMDDVGYGVGVVVESRSSEEEENLIAEFRISRNHPATKVLKPNKQVPHAAKSPGVPGTSRSQPRLLVSNSSDSKHACPLCRPIVTFTDFTTHIPLTQLPTPSYTDNQNLRLHSPYTTAETTRGRLIIQRSCALYTPGTWASPEGCEKLDTSLMNENWEDVERMWGIETRTQEMETQEGLHVRSWIWVFIWWAKQAMKWGVRCTVKRKRVLVEDVRRSM